METKTTLLSSKVAVFKVPELPVVTRLKQLAVFVERCIHPTSKLITHDPLASAGDLVSHFVMAHWRKDRPPPTKKEVAVYLLFVAQTLLACDGLLAGKRPDAETFGNMAGWDGLQLCWAHVRVYYYLPILTPASASQMNSAAYNFARAAMYYTNKRLPAAAAATAAAAALPSSTRAG